ncbi:hypothetical protein GIB67_017268 [Kingdonia uniflora]|uniref:Lachrymatory factor synthase n=1 Tax=Kingdonia uniflora TaxID=39325 RepID=A0A7J7N3M3_9MAGN|nr:hypothetical protein GIB67_017268 [Kingdonia uniflora]
MSPNSHSKMEEEQKKDELQWNAKLKVKLTGPTADQIWYFLYDDYFNLHKWLPNLSVCRPVEGKLVELGCVRYCVGADILSQDGKCNVVSWANEKLVAVDIEQKSFTYEIVDGNIGFNSYVSTMKVVDKDDDGCCWIEWSFVVDPIEGWKFEDLVSMFELGLQGMARRMEDASV